MKLLKYPINLFLTAWKYDLTKDFFLPWFTLAVLAVFALILSGIFSLFNAWFVLGVLTGYITPTIRREHFGEGWRIARDAWN